MIPDCEKRLQKAYAELTAMLVSAVSIFISQLFYKRNEYYTLLHQCFK